MANFLKIRRKVRENVILSKVCRILRGMGSRMRSMHGPKLVYVGQ